MSARPAIALLTCALCGSAHAVEAALEGFAWQATLGLALVLATIAFAAWLLRRLTRAAGTSRGPIQTVAVLSVGPRERVVLVECANTWVVVGVAPGHVSALHTLPRPSAQSASDESVAMPVETRRAGFRHWLEQAMGGQGVR